MSEQWTTPPIWEAQLAANGNSWEVLWTSAPFPARIAYGLSEKGARLIAAAPDLKAFADRIIICIVDGDESKLLLRFDGHLICALPANGAAAHGLLRMEGERAAAIAKASPSPSVQEEK